MARLFRLVLAFAATAGALQLAPHALGAQSAPVLTGHVTSAEEGAMEGVLVNAKKDGSNKTVTVVTDAQGRYAFPASHLEPGKYTVTIRAAGYELGAPATSQVTGSVAATADLKLVKTTHLAAQLTNGEWLNSAPGTDAQLSSTLGS